MPSPTVQNFRDSNALAWQRPPPDQWKFNCDGAFSPSAKRAAFAVIARNSVGDVMDINSGSKKVGSALAAEAWALRVARSMGVSLGIPHPLIESGV